MKKLKIKDYNKELEEVLINKDFSKETKNLLSSMLYKVENSYDDFKKTKVEVPSKKQLLEELIEIIKEDCKKIELVKLKTTENQIPEGKKSISIKEEQKIITYQNELSLLKAVYELNSNKFDEESEELEEVIADNSEKESPEVTETDTSTGDDETELTESEENIDTSTDIENSEQNPIDP
jgi:hypothetical protein